MKGIYRLLVAAKDRVISAQDVLVCEWLSFLSWHRGDSYQTSAPNLSEATGIPLPSLRKSLQRLERNGFLSWEGNPTAPTRKPVLLFSSSDPPRSEGYDPHRSERSDPGSDPHRSERSDPQRSEQRTPQPTAPSKIQFPENGASPSLKTDLKTDPSLPLQGERGILREGEAGSPVGSASPSPPETKPDRTEEQIREWNEAWEKANAFFTSLRKKTPEPYKPLPPRKTLP